MAKTIHLVPSGIHRSGPHKTVIVVRIEPCLSSQSKLNGEMTPTMAVTFHHLYLSQLLAGEYKYEYCLDHCLADFPSSSHTYTFTVVRKTSNNFYYF